jgi:type VI protein secretion system component VasK
METQKEQQYALCSYEYHRAKNNFEYFIAGSTVNALFIIAMLFVHFYQVPYVFEGLLSQIISLGLVLFPLMMVGAWFSWHRLKAVKEQYDQVRLEMLEDIYQRLKESN